MAECLLLKSGGQTKKLPVLNASYPANVTNWQGEQATFKVEISTPGVPAEYTYQWYRDGAKWTEATNATVSWSGASIGSHSIYCVVTNKAGEVTSRVATLTVTSMPSAASWREISRPSVVPANTNMLNIAVSSRCYHLSVNNLCFCISNENSGHHVYGCIPQFLRGEQMMLRPFSANVSYIAANGIRLFVLQQNIAGIFQMLRSCFRSRII